MPSLTTAQCENITEAGYERMLEGGSYFTDCDRDAPIDEERAYQIDCIAISTFGPPSFYEFTDSFTGVVTNIYSLTTEGI
jgi:hypothetical protein